MKKATMMFLNIAVILIGFPILVLCIFLVPEIGYVARLGLYKLFCYRDFLCSSYPFYLALYRAYKLLLFIDKNKAFSESSVIALKKIKYCAITISCLHVLNVPLFYLFAEIDDAPGAVFVGLVVPIASMVIAVFAAVLQRLFQEALYIKSENDLTV
ncbi:hypothetical protein CAI16_14455 [Virgibacillus dokdonensis]|uniref:DUF2975 domain-containing protein n=1 Tax=Virgibacillus dokdonensis TaxID=302167 RepID=A0A3E0WNK4_9BACI|nr:DUF2975 domain-containing protein [Virgibacillus dokdonensis]RFA33535.1 hypothetical protein CAI16_14455 [Virgibacillus dokdonensis]